MTTDKELALKMLDAIEDLYTENRVYKALFKALKGRMPPQQQVDQMMTAAKAKILEQVRQEFAPLRARIQQTVDLSEALEEFLRVAPSKKDVN